VKHKQSAKKIERVILKNAKKEAKEAEVNTVEMSDTNEAQPTEVDKVDAKMERKKANAPKNAYKRMIRKTKHFS
jgi:hypothetical protein